MNMWLLSCCRMKVDCKPEEDRLVIFTRARRHFCFSLVSQCSHWGIPLFETCWGFLLIPDAFTPLLQAMNVIPSAGLCVLPDLFFFEFFINCLINNSFQYWRFKKEHTWIKAIIVNNYVCLFYLPLFIYYHGNTIRADKLKNNILNIIYYSAMILWLDLCIISEIPQGCSVSSVWLLTLKTYFPGHILCELCCFVSCIASTLKKTHWYSCACAPTVSLCNSDYPVKEVTQNHCQDLCQLLTSCCAHAARQPDLTGLLCIETRSKVRTPPVDAVNTAAA